MPHNIPDNIFNLDLPGITPAEQASLDQLSHSATPDLVPHQEILNQLSSEIDIGPTRPDPASIYQTLSQAPTQVEPEGFWGKLAQNPEILTLLTGLAVGAGPGEWAGTGVSQGLADLQQRKEFQAEQAERDAMRRERYATTQAGLARDKLTFDENVRQAKENERLQKKRIEIEERTLEEAIRGNRAGEMKELVATEKGHLLDLAANRALTGEDDLTLEDVKRIAPRFYAQAGDFAVRAVLSEGSRQGTIRQAEAMARDFSLMNLAIKQLVIDPKRKLSPELVKAIGGMSNLPPLRKEAERLRNIQGMEAAARSVALQKSVLEKLPYGGSVVRVAQLTKEQLRQAGWTSENSQNLHLLHDAIVGEGQGLFPTTKPRGEGEQQWTLDIQQQIKILSTIKTDDDARQVGLQSFEEAQQRMQGALATLKSRSSKDDVQTLKSIVKYIGGKFIKFPDGTPGAFPDPSNYAQWGKNKSWEPDEDEARAWWTNALPEIQQMDPLLAERLFDPRFGGTPPPFSQPPAEGEEESWWSWTKNKLGFTPDKDVPTSPEVVAGANIAQAPVLSQSERNILQGVRNELEGMKTPEEKSANLDQFISQAGTSLSEPLIVELRRLATQ